MTSTLWAFGDSYTVGHELGTGISFKEMTSWLQTQVGVSSLDAARALFNGEEYHARVSRPWYKHIDHKISPELSYAGLIASKLSLNYINKAQCSSGVDFSFRKIMEERDNIDWNNDTVIFGVPPFNRWKSHYDDINYSHNRAITYEKSTVIPNLDSLYSWNISLVHTLQSMFPSIKIINLGMNLKTHSLESIIKYNNDITINDMVDEHIFGRYPGFHPTEVVHEQFADYLIKEVL